MSPSRWLRLPVVALLEAGLGIVGIALSQWRDPNWRLALHVPGPLSWLLASAPLLAFGWIATSPSAMRIAPLARIYRDLSGSLIAVLIRNGAPLSLGVVALSAGIGEELLFREGVQGWIGIVAASVLFGAMHAISLSYFITAVAMGAYFGWLYELTGGSWIFVAALHAGYDWVALVRYRARFRADAISASPVDSSPH